MVGALIALVVVGQPLPVRGGESALKGSAHSPISSSPHANLHPLPPAGLLASREAREGRGEGGHSPNSLPPGVDRTELERNTKLYNAALTQHEALTRRIDTSEPIEALIRGARRQTGPTPSGFERLSMPIEPSSSDLASLLRAAMEVRTASQTYAGAVEAERAKIEASIDAMAPSLRREALRKRLEAVLADMERRSNEVRSQAGPIAGALEQRAGSLSARLEYVLRQVAHTDGETQLGALEAELKSWGEDREPEILGSSLTYVKGALSAPAMPDGGITPAYLAGDSAPASLGLVDAGGGSEIVLSTSVVAEAQTLRNAAAAVNFVKNTFQLDWYAGCEKDSNETLAEGRGNDVDLAGLLIALLTAQGTEARYVQGTIQLPLARVADLMGLLSAADEQALFSPDAGAPPYSLPQATGNLVLQALGSAGIAYQPVLAGGQVVAVQLTHTWVEAYLGYADYRGVGTNPEGMQWVPIEPSFTGRGKYVVTPASSDGFGALGADAGALTAGYLSAPTTASMLQYLETVAGLALPNGVTFGQTLRQVQQNPETASLVVGSLPYQVLSVQGEYAFLPDSAKHHLKLVAQDSNGTLLSTTVPLHQVTGHRTTFTFQAATPVDQELMDAAGGPYSAPAAAVQVLLAFRVDGAVESLATRSVGLGAGFTWTVTLELPNGSTQQIQNQGIAGNLIAFGIGSPTNGFVESEVPSATDLDGPAPRFLYALAVAYANAWTTSEDELASFLDVVPVHPTANVVFVENQLQVDTVTGIPSQVEWKGLEVDSDLRTMVPLELQPGRGAALLLLSGYEGSYQEQAVLVAGTGEPSISAVNVIQEANAQGVPVVTLTSANAAALLPGVSAPTSVLTDVANQLAQGRVVQIPIALVTVQDWTGTGYIAIDPATEEGGYFLSGIVSGGMTVITPSSWTFPDVQQLQQPLTGNTDAHPADATQVRIVTGDLQNIMVGQPAKPLTVQVLNATNQPVQGAVVTFSRSGLVPSLPGLAPDSATLSGLLAGSTPAQIQSQAQASAAPVTVPTNGQGLATAYVTPDPVIANAPLSIVVSPAQYAQLEGMNLIAVSVAGPAVPLQLAKPFQVVGLPGPLTQLVQSVYPGPAVCGWAIEECASDPSTVPFPAYTASQAATCSGSPSQFGQLSPGLCVGVEYLVADGLGVPFGVAVQDAFGNALANQPVTWTNQISEAPGLPPTAGGSIQQGFLGTFVDPADPAAMPLPGLWDLTNPAEHEQLTEVSPTDGVATAVFYHNPNGDTGRYFTAVLAWNGNQFAGFQVDPTFAGGSTNGTGINVTPDFFFSMSPTLGVPSGVNGTSSAPQVAELDAVDPDTGASAPVTLPSPYAATASVTMYVTDANGAVQGTPVTKSPTATNPQMTFEPPYVLPNGAETVSFYANATTASGDTVYFYYAYTNAAISANVQATVERVDASGNSVALNGEPALATDQAIRYLVQQPSDTPIFFSVTPTPVTPGDTIVSLPGLDAYPRNPTYPNLLQVPGNSTATPNGDGTYSFDSQVFDFPLAPGTGGGTLTFTVYAPDFDDQTACDIANGDLLQAADPLGRTCLRSQGTTRVTVTVSSFLQVVDVDSNPSNLSSDETTFILQGQPISAPVDPDQSFFLRLFPPPTDGQPRTVSIQTTLADSTLISELQVQLQPSSTPPYFAGPFNLIVALEQDLLQSSTTGDVTPGNNPTSVGSYIGIPVVGALGPSVAQTGNTLSITADGTLSIANPNADVNASLRLLAVIIPDVFSNGYPAPNLNPSTLCVGRTLDQNCPNENLNSDFVTIVSPLGSVDQTVVDAAQMLASKLEWSFRSSAGSTIAAGPIPVDVTVGGLPNAATLPGSEVTLTPPTQMSPVSLSVQVGGCVGSSGCGHTVNITTAGVTELRINPWIVTNHNKTSIPVALSDIDEDVCDINTVWSQACYHFTREPTGPQPIALFLVPSPSDVPNAANNWLDGPYYDQEGVDDSVDNLLHNWDVHSAGIVKDYFDVYYRDRYAPNPNGGGTGGVTTVFPAPDGSGAIVTSGSVMGIGNSNVYYNPLNPSQLLLGYGPPLRGALVAHELGHAMGLEDTDPTPDNPPYSGPHSTNAHSLMFPSIPAIPQTNVDVSEDEVDHAYRQTSY